jgi:predicted  nucleic acid-binding Zn-ribbon protein
VIFKLSNIKPHLTEHTITQLLNRIIIISASSQNVNLLELCLVLARIVLHSSTTCPRTMAVLKESVKSVFNESSVKKLCPQQDIDSYVELPSNTGACRGTIAEIQRRLTSSMCVILTMCVAGYAHVFNGKNEHLLAEIVARQQRLMLQTSSCTHNYSRSRNQQPLQILDLVQIPTTTENTLDWKLKLENQLYEEHLQQRQLILRAVGLACKDLEDRCATVEEPLRKEQEQNSLLQVQLIQCKTELSEMSAKVADQKLFFDSLEKEKMDQEVYLRKLECENEELSRRAVDLEQEASQIRNAAAQSVAALEHSYEEKLNRCRTAVAAKDDDLSKKEKTIHNLQKTIDTLTFELSQQCTQISELVKRENEANTTLAEVKQELQAANIARAEKDRELDHASKNSAALVAKVTGLEAELGKSTEMLYQAEQDYFGEISRLQNDCEVLQKQHEVDLQAVADKVC